MIADYMEMVPTMAKRSRTKENRLFRAKKLLAFVEATDADMPISRFDAGMFEGYPAWLRDVRGHAPQTIENALIGARTFLRWAVTQKFIAAAPKAPEFRVPAIEHAPLYVEDVEALLAAAESPLDVMLKLMWLAGLRISEASTLRRIDLIDAENLIAIRKHGDFVPKTPKSTRTIPVTPEMMAELVQLAGDDPAAPIFVCPVKCRYHYWRHRFDKAKRDAGLRHFTFHDFRRAVSDRFRSIGTPIDRYCKFMGHSAITGLRHYSVVDPDDLHADVLAALGAARTRKGDKGRSTADGGLDPEEDQ